MSFQQKNFLAFSLLLIQPIFMASNWIIAKAGVQFVPPVSLAFWRWLIVFFILLPFTLVSLKNNFNIIKNEYKNIFFLGLTGCGICGAFPFLAGQTTSVTNIGIIYSSSPIFIVLISMIFFKEKISLYKISGLFLCLMGVGVILVKGRYSILVGLKFTLGDFWMLASSIGWATYSIFLFHWKTKLEIFQRFTLIAFFGALSLLPFYLLEEIFIKETIFNSKFFIWTFFASISPGIIAFTLYTVVQKKLGASVTGLTLYIGTIYGAIYGYLFFEEKIEIYHYVGTILVFLGVYIAKKNYETKT